ncbi:hypothetical protein ACIQ34_20565 [Ureibacillus sp. NPDC094379]
MSSVVSRPFFEFPLLNMVIFFIWVKRRPAMLLFASLNFSTSSYPFNSFSTNLHPLIRLLLHPTFAMYQNKL